MKTDNGSHYRSIFVSSILTSLGPGPLPLLRSRFLRSVIVLSLITLSACSGSADNDDGKPQVIVTTGILGDVVANIAGDAIELTVLMPPGVDPHEFAPSAQQVAAISGADLVIANGFGLEEGLLDLLEQTRSEGIAVFEVGPGVNPRQLPEGTDPHFWQDPELMVTATALIASALINDLGLDYETTSQAAAAYGLEIERAHIEAEGLLSAVPEDLRVMVTNHYAFEYFAERYGYRIVGTIIPGRSTLGAPSSAHLAHLVEVIIETGVPAIFVENIADPSLAVTLAQETGREIAVVELISDALGEPGSATGSYLGLIRYNAQTISGALNG